MEDDDLLAIFPVSWIFSPDLTKSPLDAEQTSGAHFDILGPIHIEFADYLRDNAEMVDVSRWISLFES